MIALIIILIILIINWFSGIQMLNGSWESTDEFTDLADTKIYLDIKGIFKKDCRFIFMKDESIIKDSNAYMIGSPHGWFLPVKTWGFIYFTGDVPFPKKLKYCFDPWNSILKLYADKVYGVFRKF